MKTVKNGEWLELTVPTEINEKTIEYFLKNIWQVPKKLLHEMRMGKSVKVNNEIIPWTNQLKTGQILQVRLFQKEAYGVIPTPIKLDVLYEDDHMLIINKPAGMDTHPTNETHHKTVANAVANYFQEKNIHSKVRHIHRLDKDTTGAILFAKHALAGAMLDRLLESRTIKRTYLALVEGKLKRNRGTINHPIGRDRHHATKRRVSPTGQHAVTHFERLTYDASKDATLVKLQLDSGRTHQIRVHMSHIGHPLLGDQLYDGRKISFIKRQALHAAKIQLPHPFTGEMLMCIAPFFENEQIFSSEVLNFLK
jgi:23S rRNA pseudouridine1911/1915/1917 synthase